MVSIPQWFDYGFVFRLLAYSKGLRKMKVVFQKKYLYLYCAKERFRAWEPGQPNAWQIGAFLKGRPCDLYRKGDLPPLQAPKAPVQVSRAFFFTMNHVNQEHFGGPDKAEAGRRQQSEKKLSSKSCLDYEGFIWQ